MGASLVNSATEWYSASHVGGTFSATERTMFGAPPVAFGGVDFIGYTLTSISLQFDQIGFG
ncbi:MAG: hypothetical protein JNK85_22105 [Verrucomicrobiales bacterium]|nr:hypothetical protein [Verrucomicrobiales bacterium]